MIIIYYTSINLVFAQTLILAVMEMVDQITAAVDAKKFR